MQVFITGASGAIGRRVVPLLLADGHEVTAVARSMIGRAQLMHLGATAIDLNLFDPSVVRSAVAGHDVLINLASHVRQSAASVFRAGAWRDTDRLHRDPSALLTEACLDAGVPRFIQESFAPVYPDSGDRWIDETMPIRPQHDDGSVTSAEAAVERFSREGGIGLVLRFGCFYGSDASQTADAIKWVRKGWVPIPGSPGAYISSVSHDDGARAAAAAVRLRAGVYNVVDDQPVTHRAYFESLARALGVAVPRFPPPWVTPLSGSVGEMVARSLRISNRKLREACDWIPAHGSVCDAWPALVARLRAAESVGSLWPPIDGSTSPCLTKPFN